METLLKERTKIAGRTFENISNTRFQTCITYHLKLPINDIYENIRGEDIEGYIKQGILDKAKQPNLPEIDGQFMESFIKSEIKNATFNDFQTYQIDFSASEFILLINKIHLIQSEYDLKELDFNDLIIFFSI